jgi:uncharacterized membrane protein YhaH (DUF805 family)
MFIKKLFSGCAGRLEFSIYFLLEIIAQVSISYLNANKNYADKTVLYQFYASLIFLITFIPIQAATTRRLRDIQINTGWIFVNFIPVVNFLFKIYLCFPKSKIGKKLSHDINQIARK